jgi:hypothetical protein
MALPLVSAMFGSTGVFLASAHIVCMAAVLWTYGVFTWSGKLSHPVRQILLNPGVLAGILGVLLFCSPVKMPSLLDTAVSYMASLNTPLAMLVLGCYLAQLDLKACFTDVRLWKLSFVRLVLIPLCSVALLSVLPLDQTARLTLLVGLSAPTAIASAMFAQLYETDYLFATRAVALSTLLSAVTLPAIIALTEWLNTLLPTWTTVMRLAG